MITGVVDFRYEAFITLTLFGPIGQETTIDFLVDTGFNGALMLPDHIIQALGLMPRSSRVMRLADDTLVDVALYEANVAWNGAKRTVLVLASGSEPLLGMTLLRGHRLTVDVIDGGLVSIEPL